MDICEYADIINANMQIMYYHNQDRRFSCHFEYCEVKNGAFLLGEYGNGKSPEDAINNYVSLIKGKRIIFSAMSSNRREFDVPVHLQGLLKNKEAAATVV